MDKYRLQWVGSKCGQHGPYNFFKSFKFSKNSKWRTLSLGEFFFVKCSETDPLCIAELQLLWEDKAIEGIMLSSSRLYFLPEHTPDGRHHSHGDDEVIAVNSKIIMSIEDLLDWVIMDEVQWIDGFPTICPNNGLSEKGTGKSQPLLAEGQIGGSTQERDRAALEKFALNSGLKVKDVIYTRKISGCSRTPGEQKVMIVSYPSYCRHHANLKRVDKKGDQWHNNTLLKALGLLLMPHPDAKLLFCRSEFDHPTLEDDERLGEYTAPKLKGRPRKKKVKLKSEDSDKYIPPRHHMTSENAQLFLNRKDFDSRKSRSKFQPVSFGESLMKLKAEFKHGKLVSEELFLTHLYQYMKEQNTPIDRIPNLGFKQIDLFAFFELAVQLGGYKSITARKQWKVIYDQLGGNPGSTSAATCTRKHYERLLLPFEHYLRTADKLLDPGNSIRDRKEHKHRKKEKKEKKRTRVKHVREQLQELEARRAAERKVQEEANCQQVAGVMKTEFGSPSITVTNPTVTAAITTTSSTTAHELDIKPAISINGAPLIALPSMVPSSSTTLPSMVQLSGNQLFPQLNLKNMAPVILAIPQVPVIAATSMPKSDSASPVVGHQAQDQKSQPLTSTVLDKVGGGIALLPSRDASEVKKNISSKTEHLHQVINHAIIKKESNLENKSKSVESNLSRSIGCSSCPTDGGVNGLSSTNKEGIVPRPSVIQHTHHSKGNNEREVLPSKLTGSQLAYMSGMQPSDLVVKNMVKEHKPSEHELHKKDVEEIPDLLGPGPRFLTPYMTFLHHTPFLFRPSLDPSVQLSASKAAVTTGSKISQESMEDMKSKSALLETATVKPPLSLSQQTRGSSPSVSHSMKCGPVPVQEEPCDLSMPKKRRWNAGDDGDEPSEKQRDSVINKANVLSSSSTIRNSPVHRLRTSDKKFLKHSSSYSHSHDYPGKHPTPSSASFSCPTLSSSYHASPSQQSVASSSKVKMTPNPRGSITQGIINPTKNQAYSLQTNKDSLETLSTPSAKTPNPDLASPRHVMESSSLGLPVAVDSSGKPLPPLTDFNPLTRYPHIFPYVPFLPRPPFLTPGAHFIPAALPRTILSSQAEMLQRNILCRPPFPYPPTVPYSSPQLTRDSQQTSLYQS
ncbi:uncharacterized protein [Diadema setosum]|uniref:uncharacterized protein isoform X2 n=1 Tax=Diadema setosum TaxID=31175 RepID=UPI003B3AB65F